MKVTQEVDAFTRHPDQSRPAHRWRLQIPENPNPAHHSGAGQGSATRIMSKLEEIDFKGLITSLDETVNGIKRTVNSPELELTIRSLQKTVPKIDEAVVSIRDLAVTLNDNSKSLAANLEQTSIDARASDGTRAKGAGTGDGHVENRRGGGG